VLRLAWYIRPIRFEIESDGRFDSNAKNDLQVPNLTVQTAPCYVLSFWHNTGVWRTERRTDGRMEMP